MATSNKLLCVDDDANMVAYFRLLHGRQGLSGEALDIDTAQSGPQALEAIAGRGPYAAILTDMNMPGMNGIQLLSRVRQVAPDSVRMMLTGCADLQLAIDALNEGHIFRFLTKPCTPTTLFQAFDAGIRQYRLVTAEKELLEKTLTGAIKALTDILSLANPSAFGRAQRVRRRVQGLAAALGVADAWQLEVAALLSQTGCVTMPEQLLEKVHRGADLSPAEAALYRSHPQVGHDLIRAIPRLEAVAEIVAYQHKGFDGSGLPADDRQGEAIPLGARILKVALDFDRLEVRGWPRARALARLQQHRAHYDPAVLEALQKALESDTPLGIKEVGVHYLLAQLERIVAAEEKGLDPAQEQEVLRGMVLAEDMVSERGVLLLSKGHEITRTALEVLRKIARRTPIREPIRLWVPVPTRTGDAFLAPGQEGPALPAELASLGSA